MKKLLLLISIVSSITFLSCEKSKPFGEKEEVKFEFACEIGDCVPCDNLDFVDPSTIGKTVQQIILEPIQYDDDCGCIIRGMVKYVDCGKTQAIVYYGDGECDGIGIRVICVDGDCDVPEAQTCEFDMECQFN